MVTTSVSKRVKAKKATVNTRVRSSKRIKNQGLKGSSVTSVKLGAGGSSGPPVIVVQGSSSSGGGGSSSSSSSSTTPQSQLPSPLLAGNNRGFGPGFYQTPYQGAFAPSFNFTQPSSSGGPTLALPAPAPAQAPITFNLHNTPQASLGTVSATGGAADNQATGGRGLGGASRASGQGGGGGRATGGSGGGATQDIYTHHPPPPPAPGAPGILRSWGGPTPDDGVVYMRSGGGGDPPDAPGGAGRIRLRQPPSPSKSDDMDIDPIFQYNGGGPPPPSPGAGRVKVRVVDPGGSISEPILALYKDELERARGSQAQMIDLLREQQQAERAQAKILLTTALDRQQPQQVAQAQPPPDPFGGGGAIMMKMAFDSGFDSLKEQLRGLRSDLTEVQRANARGSEESQSARDIQAMIKGLEVKINRGKDTDLLQQALREVQDAKSRLDQRPPASPGRDLLLEIKQGLGQINQRLDDLESKAPVPMLTSPAAPLRVVKDASSWGQNFMAEQNAAMQGAVKPGQSFAERMQEQFAIEEGLPAMAVEGGSLKRKLDPSSSEALPRPEGFLGEYWPTNGVKVEYSDL